MLGETFHSVTTMSSFYSRTYDGNSGEMAIAMAIEPFDISESPYKTRTRLQLKNPWITFKTKLEDKASS